MERFRKASKRYDRYCTLQENKKFSSRKFRKIKNKNPNNYMVPEILLSIVNNSRDFCSNP